MNLEGGALALTTSLLMACHPSDVATDGAGLGEAQDAIINGAIDVDHPSTVSLGTAGDISTCSGTIVKVDPPWAYVLTATHCVENDRPRVVRVGHLDNVIERLVVVEVMENPTYVTAITWGRDVAVLRVIGATNATPVTPIATIAEDTLDVGDNITFAGYGLTENGTPSTERRSIVRPIVSLTPSRIKTSQDGGGICFGDSGGPGFAELAVGRRVVGINSALANQQCTGWAGESRASYAYDSFILPRLEKPTFDACTVCSTNALIATECRTLFEACLVTGTDCELYNTCLAGCSDEACETACAVTHTDGKITHDEVFQCSCDRCSPMCETEPICGVEQTGCGFRSNDAACNTCVEGCCAEARACRDNGECAWCFPDCDTNPTADALWQCLDNAQCLGTCGLDIAGGIGDGGAGGSSTSAGPSTTIAAAASSTGSGGAAAGGAGGTGDTTTGGGAIVSASSGSGGDNAAASTGGCSTAGSRHLPRGLWSLLALAWVRRLVSRARTLSHR